MKVKAPDASAAKWAARANAAGPAYTAGVQNPKTDWAQATSNAAPNWAAGVTAAATSGSFAKGVTKAGTPKWQNGAVNKGASRYGPGVQSAQPAYLQGSAPYMTALSNATLPQKFPRGDINNQQRSNFVQTLLRNVKLGKTS